MFFISISFLQILPALSKIYDINLSHEPTHSLLGQKNYFER